MVEDEELAAASDVADNALAEELLEEGAAVHAPDGHPREDLHPATADGTLLDLVLDDEVLPVVLG